MPVTFAAHELFATHFAARFGIRDKRHDVDRTFLTTKVFGYHQALIHTYLLRDTPPFCIFNHAPGFIAHLRLNREIIEHHLFALSFPSLFPLCIKFTCRETYPVAPQLFATSRHRSKLHCLVKKLMCLLQGEVVRIGFSIFLPLGCAHIVIDTSCKQKQENTQTKIIFLSS